MTQKEFKVGDKVFDIRYGWGIVKSIYLENEYPIFVEFKSSVVSYSLKGEEDDKDFIALLSHHEYTLQPVERVVLVSGDGKEWCKRVLLMEKEGLYICWVNAETLEEAKSKIRTHTWSFMKELPTEEIVELTIKDISEGKGKGVPPHLIRIKDA